MQRINKLSKLLTLIKRCLSDSSFKGNKHYDVCIKHIKTELNNRAYILKKTTAIPKEISYFKSINFQLPKELQPVMLHSNPTLHPIDYLNFKLKDEKYKYRDEVYLQELINNIFTPNAIKQNRNSNCDICACKVISPPSKYLNGIEKSIPAEETDNSVEVEVKNSRLIMADDNTKIEKFQEQEDKLCSNCDPHKKNTDLHHQGSKMLSVTQMKEKNMSYVNLTQMDNFNVEQNNQSPTNISYMGKHENIFSLAEIRKMVNKRMMDNLKLKEISPHNILILNPDKPTKTTLIYFKDNGLHVMENPCMEFDLEIKNYIKKLGIIENNKFSTERLNIIRFYKVPYMGNIFQMKLTNNYSTYSELNLSALPISLSNMPSEASTKPTFSERSSATDLGIDLNGILKEHDSLPLEKNSEKCWITCEEENIDLLNKFSNDIGKIDSKVRDRKTELEGNFSVLQYNKELSSKSGPPFSDKVPINRDKLIEETVVPNTSILNIINSIDKSALIIQKDLYITDQIIQKIQKDEEKGKQKVIEKNKLETSGVKPHILYLDGHFLKDDKVTLFLSDLTAGIKRKLFNGDDSEVTTEVAGYKEMASNCEFFGSKAKGNINEGADSLMEKKSGYVTDIDRHNSVLDSEQINERSTDACKTTGNFNSKRTTNKMKGGGMIMNKQTNSIFTYSNEENKSNIQEQVNKTYNANKNEDFLLINDVHFLNKQNEEITEKNDLVSTGNSETENWNETFSYNNENLNTSESLMTENNILLKTHTKKENQKLGLFLKLQSIDKEGNMIFNLLDKAGRAVSVLNFLVDEGNCKQNIMSKNVNKGVITMQLLKLKSTNNLNSSKSVHNNNDYQVLTKDNHNITNGYAIYECNHQVPQLQKGSNKSDNKIQRTGYSISEAEKLDQPEVSRRKTNTTQYKSKDCCSNAELIPMDYQHGTQNNMELNEINKYQPNIKLQLQRLKKILNSKKPKSMQKQIAKLGSLSCDLYPLIKEDIKRSGCDVINKSKSEEELDHVVNSSKTNNNLEANTNKAFLKLKVEADSMVEENKLPVLAKTNILLPDCSSIIDNSVECLFKGVNNNTKQNTSISKQNFRSLAAKIPSNKSVDHIKKTTISSIKKNNFTDIKVSEVETFVDSRLPIPFSTETFFQIFGSNSSLHDHSTLIDSAKYKLTTPNKTRGYPTNMDVMAKLDDIQKSVQKLNLLTIHPASPKNKNTRAENKSLIPAKELNKHSMNSQYVIKKKNTLEKKNDNNKISTLSQKLSLKTDKPSRLPIKISDSKQEQKKSINYQHKKKEIQIENQDNNQTLSREKKSLLVLRKNHKTEHLKETTKQDIKDTKMNQTKGNAGLRQAGLHDTNKLIKDNYVDLFHLINSENEKKNLKFTVPKKSIYDHKELSKRDKNILREITKEIPKQKPHRQRNRRRQSRSVTSKKAVKEQAVKKGLKEPINQQLGESTTKPSKTNFKSNKRSELVVKENFDSSKTLSEKKKNILIDGNQIEKKTVDIRGKKVENVTTNKPFKAKPNTIPGLNKPASKALIDERPQKSLPIVNKMPTDNDTQVSSKEQPKKKRVVKSVEINTNSDNKNDNVGQSKKYKQISLETKEFQNTKFQEHDENHGEKVYKKPLCHTYIATEAYINQIEKVKMIPDKPLTFHKVTKIIENNKPLPAEQKVTILEKYDKSIKEETSQNLEIQEHFKEALIKKSQKKIEQKSNIDFRVRTPKIKNPKSKLIILKASTQKGKMNSAFGYSKTAEVKKGVRKAEMKIKPLTPKSKLKNKMDSTNFKGAQTPAKLNIVNKLEAPLENNRAKDDQKKSDISKNDSGIQQKEIFSGNKEEANKKFESNYGSEMHHKEVSSEHHRKAVEMSNNSESSLKERTKNINISGPGLKQEAAIAPTEKNNKKDFPMLLIDVDKMSKEIKPELDLYNCKQCKVPLDRITDFPIYNPKKKLFFSPSSRILNLGPSQDPMLRKELNVFPSVTKILNSTIPEDSRDVLREWRRSMINKLGENGFKLFYKGQLSNGSKFHTQLHDYLLNGTVLKDGSIHQSMKSIKNVLNRLTDLCAVNSHVIHRKLAYRGVIDCIAKYQNKPVLIEWKRLENPNVKVVDTCFDVASVQLSAYTGAVNYDNAYKFQLDGGLIVVAYNDGSEAEVIEINKDQCSKQWKAWLKRLQNFHESVKKKN